MNRVIPDMFFNYTNKNGELLEVELLESSHCCLCNCCESWDDLQGQLQYTLTRELCRQGLAT